MQSLSICVSIDQTLRGLMGYAMSMLDAPTSSAPAVPLSKALLQKGDDTTSNVRLLHRCPRASRHHLARGGRHVASWSRCHAARAAQPAPTALPLLQAIIAAFRDDATFAAFAKREMEAIVARDNEDGEKLAVSSDSLITIPRTPRAQGYWEADAATRADATQRSRTPRARRYLLS